MEHKDVCILKLLIEPLVLLGIQNFTHDLSN